MADAPSPPPSPSAEPPRPGLAPAGAARILLTSAPPGAAQDLARTLVEERLAACVSLLPGARSVYRWEGALHDDPETLLVVKTVEGRLEELSARLEALHPYEVPEQLTLAPEGGARAYLAWLGAETAPPAPPAAGPDR